MPQSFAHGLDRVRRRLTRMDESGLTDAHLLGRFVDAHDADAFAALVRRHGPMVLGVCRRIVGHAHDAEDAFQATFLVLARRAGSVVPRDKLGNWLYGVACRVAREARAAKARRTARVTPVPELPERAVEPVGQDRPELRALLDRELERLPEYYRLPVVLCELEGRSRKDVAHQLRIPEGTLSSRLAKARRLLAARLRRQGVAASAGIGALATAHPGAAVCPPELFAATVRAALAFAAGQATGLNPAVAALARETLKMLSITRLRGIAVSVLAAFLACGIGSALLLGGAAETPPTAKPAKEAADKVPARPKEGRIVIWRQRVVGEPDEPRLQIVSPDGKESAWLTDGFGAEEQPSGFAVSPDGTRVAYGVPVEAAEGEHDTPEVIHIKSVADQKPGRSLNVPGHQWAWSPDGKELVVARFTPEGIENSVVNAETGAVQALNLPAVPLPGEKRESARHLVTDWSRDGDWFLTTVLPPDDKGKSYLFRVKRDGSKAEPVAGDTAALGGRFAPDGKRVLFEGVDSDPNERPIKKTRLYATEIGKGKPWLVSQELNADITGYCWSPDGQRIAYAFRAVPENPQPDQETESFLMVVDPDGKNAVTVLTEKGNSPGTLTLGGVDWK